jgi:hypothetical protein
VLVAGRWRPGGSLVAAVCTLALIAPGSASAASETPRALRAAVAPRHELSPTQRITLPGGAVVRRFQQRVGGRPVLGAQAISDRAPGEPARLVADTTRPGIDAPGSASVGRERAIALARSSVRARGLRAPVGATLAIKPGDGGLLVWRVLVPSARPLGDFEVLVDAANGEVVARNDLMRNMQKGVAKLYRVNPVVQNRGARRLRSDVHDRDTPVLRRLRRRVGLSNLESGQHCLRGRWAHALRGRKDKETCKPSLNWRRVTRADGRFEALEVYFQINRSQRYIQRLGFSDSNPAPNGIVDRRQRAVANAYGLDNSAYSPFTQTITFGTGGVDDGEDGDIVAHEYAHAMQDSQSPAFGDSTRYNPVALAEGSSDYWAAVMSSRAPRSANEDDVCIFDWDATTYGKFYPRVPPEKSGRRCGRRADVTRTLDDAQAHCRRVLFGSRFAPDPHCVGEVWSSALWAIRRSVVAHERGGGPRMDRIYLASQFLYTGSESFQDAARALLCVDEDLHPKGTPGDCRGEDYSVIHREMRQRGILRR